MNLKVRRILSLLILVIVLFGWYVSVFGIGQYKSIKDALKFGLDINGGVYVVMEAQTDLKGKELRSVIDVYKRQVIDEAISRKCNLILSHHPLIFSKINTISDMQPKQKMIMRLISNKISVYSAHTNYDIAEGGTSDYLTKQLALDDIGVIPETDGFAVQGMLKVEMNLSLILILMSMMRRMIFLQVYIRASQGRTDLDFLNILQGLPQDMAEKHF